MLVNSNKYRRKKKDQAGSITVESGDTLTIASGATLAVAAGAISNLVAPNEVVVTTNVITAAESGKTFFLSLAAGFTSTLPAVAAGLNYKFIVKTAPTTAYIISTGGPDTFFGTVAANGAETEVNGIDIAAMDVVNFVANQAKVGDYVEVICDGTNWYVSGMIQDFANLTVAAT